MKRLLKIACIVGAMVLLVPGSAVSELSDAAPTVVTYKTTPQGNLALHLFLPKDKAQEGGRTAIVFFFGGGWVGGKPSQFYPFSEHLAARGIVAIAAEYRVKSRHESTVAQSVADAKSAIRYVRQHAAEWGIHPDHIISAGGSAGGHLAASTGTLDGYDEVGEDRNVSAKPNAMILLNPVVDTTPRGYTGKMLPKEGDESLSPLHHISGGTPPTLICHGTADTTVPHENVVRFKEAMEGAGNRCELESFEGAGHGFFNHRPESMEHYNAVVSTMDTFIDSLGW